jgi:hypothetical protein
MSPAKAIVTGCGGGAVVVVVDVDVVGKVVPVTWTTGESSDPTDEHATSSAATSQPALRHRTGKRYRFVVCGLSDYNLPELLSGQCCLESAWTEPIRRPTG